MSDKPEKSVENKADETKKDEEKPKPMPMKTKVIIALVITLIMGSGVGAGIYFISQSINYLTTDNARVTTTLFPVVPTMPGTLERLNVTLGTVVAENDIIGWVQNDAAMRSPVNGIVVYTSAVQDQLVSPHEPVAIIADTSDIHIRANIEETDISRLQLGQQVFVTIDTFGSRQFTGYISEIGMITQAELTGQAMFFNTGGTFTRVTHLIPIKVSLLDEDVNLDTLIGINARVRIPVR